MVDHQVEERIHPDNYMFTRHLFAYGVAERYLVRDAVAVDVGSGDGYGVRFLAERGARAIGIDREREAVVPANSKYVSERCSFVQADARAIPLQSGIAALVTSMQVLEHLEEPAEYVAEIRRLLRPDGVAVICTPYSESKSFRFQPEVSPYHVQEYDPRNLRALLGLAFGRIEIHGVRFRPGSMPGDSDQRLGKIQTFDRLNLRKILPPGLKPMLYRIFGFTPVSEIRIAIDDYELTSDAGGPEVMDLLAICMA